MVLIEALIIGILASIIGLFGGIGVAWLLKQLFSTGGGSFPDGPLQIQPRTVVVVVIVGLVVTVMSAILPAIRASRVSPLEAVRDGGQRERSMRFRILAGAAVLVPGLAALFFGMFGDIDGTTPRLTAIGVGAALTFLGVAMLSALFAGRAAAVLGLPAEAIKGITGRLARDNASRNPQRTAATATALMIGLALITGVAVLTESLLRTFDEILEEAITADLFVFEEAQGLPFSAAIIEQLDELPEVAEVTGFAPVEAKIDDTVETVSAYDTETGTSVVNIGVVEGSLDGSGGLGVDGIAVLDERAETDGLALGDTVSIELEDGFTTDLTVEVIYDDNTLVGAPFVCRPRAHQPAPQCRQRRLRRSDLRRRRRSSGWTNGRGGGHRQLRPAHGPGQHRIPGADRGSGRAGPDRDQRSPRPVSGGGVLQHRQHHGAVDPGAHPRDRTAASRRHHPPPASHRRPVGGGDRGGVRITTRHRHGPAPGLGGRGRHPRLVHQQGRHPVGQSGYLPAGRRRARCDRRVLPGSSRRSPQRPRRDSERVGPWPTQSLEATSFRALQAPYRGAGAHRRPSHSPESAPACHDGAMRLRFEGFELDTERRTLTHDDSEIEVEPRVFDVVAYLAAHVDRVVAKEELLDELWGDRFVSEWALSTAVKHARRALGDDGTQQQIIKTSHGRGYRMIAPVERIEHQAVIPADDGTASATTATGDDGGGGEDGSRRRTGADRATPLLPRTVALIGREAELERLHELNEPRSVVTIIGPGGVGKTSLALTAAHDLVDAGQHVWFCDLATQTGSGVAAAVLSVVDSTAGSGGATAERIAERIGPGRATLTLDNCEHVLDHVRTLVNDLLDLRPDLSIVATSREVLGLADERLVRLDGLRGGAPDSPAVQLFIRRGGQLGAITDTDEDRSIAVRIAEQLDGLPLALELAATRLASASAAEVLAALDDQLAVLRGDPSGERHSTMERTIDWSYQLLSPTARRVLGRLTVFRSPFRIDAATSVLAADGTDDTAEQVHRLVQSSMLSPAHGPHGTRFRLLEPIRQFVDQRIDRPSMSDLHARHAEYFAERVKTLARLLHSSDERGATAALTAEWPDVAASIRWGLDAARPDVAVEPLVQLGFHIRWQQRTEAYGWLEEALEHLDLAPELRRDALVVVALGAWTDGDLARLAELHHQARKLGDTGVRGAMLDLFADLHSDDPRRLVERADAFHRAACADDDPAWVEVASAFRLTARAIGDPDGDETAEVADELASVSRGSLWPSGRSWRLLSELTWAVRQGRAVDATAIADEIAVEAAAGGTPFFVQTAGPLLGGLRKGPVDQRLKGAAEAVRLTVATKEEVNYALSFRSAAITLHAAGNLATAARIVGFADTLDPPGHMAGVVTAEFDQVVDDLRRTLGADEYAHLVALGRRLTPASAANLVVDAAAGS